MMELQCSDASFVPPPDDLTVAQLVTADSSVHFTKPSRPTPDVPCVIHEESGKTLYLAEIQHRSDALARSLKGKWEIRPGDTVSLYSLNHLDTLTVLWAAHKLGATASAHSAALTADELVCQLKISRPALLVTHPAILKNALTAIQVTNLPQDRIILLDGHLLPNSPLSSVEELIANHEQYPIHAEYRLKPGEAKTSVAFLSYSSGTTGNPKAVRISHYNMTSNIVQNAIHSRMNDASIPADCKRSNPGDINGGALPFFHMYGIMQLHYSIYAAMGVVVSQAFNFERFLRSVEKFRITHLQLVPPQVVLLCKHPLTKNFDLSSVRCCMVAAAALSAELTEELLRVLPGITLGQGYGLTEACSGVTVFPISRKVGLLGSAGKLLPGTRAKVVQPDGSLAGIGERGELWVQGPQISLGYIDKEEQWRATCTDGWLHTGDEVMFNEEGEMFITDRIKELIKVKGLQVAPSEIEGRLLEHPDVADVGVIGVPHEYMGEAPRAYVVLKADVATRIARDAGLESQIREKLYKHVSATTAKYKWLEGGIEFVEAIPKSPSGKILRRILKQMASTERAAKSHL